MRHEPPLTDEEWELIRKHFPMLQPAPVSIQRLAVRRLQESGGMLAMRPPAADLPTLEQSLDELESISELLGPDVGRAPSGTIDRVSLAVVGPDGAVRKQVQNF